MHVQASRESYASLVPLEAFDHHSIELRIEQWSATLFDADRRTLVHERGGAVAGFISGGPIKWTGLSTDGEVSSFYLIDAVKRRGVGRDLFRQLMTVLTGRGWKSCGLWTLASNIPARRFYEAIGGHAGETRVDWRNNIAYEDISYIWDDISHVGAT